MTGFNLSDKIKELRDWFWRNSEMVRDDVNGDKWIIPKKKFNEFIELIIKQDKEFIRILKEELPCYARALNKKEYAIWNIIDKIAGGKLVE